MKQRFNPHKKFIRKNFSGVKTTVELTRAIRAVQIVRNSKIEESVAPASYNRFEDFLVNERLKENINRKNYTSPTPIQDQAIPYILAGKDLIGIANTGTGKTAAFLIPLVDKVFKNKTERVLIITPTRELALQIGEELRDFIKGMFISYVLCIGGMSLGRQKNDLIQNPNFVIGTPGRIKDLIGQRALHLSQFNNVVLDETDRMVDIGFINDIKYFISLLPKIRQSLFFSATVSDKVKSIIKSFVYDPVTVSVKQQEIVESINQDIIKVISKEQKIYQLFDLLRQEGFNKVLVFGRTKWGVQRLAEKLIQKGFKAGAIHGNKNQNQRQRVLEQFKRNDIKILLATDVASRGLDIPDVTHVINYDMPASMEDYIHRIGRTGRANKKGAALTFVE